MKNQSEGIEWINDELHDLCGMSEKHVVNYIYSLGNFNLILLAKQCKSSQEIYDKLVDFDLPSGNKTKTFSDDLYAKYGIKNFKSKISVR